MNDQLYAYATIVTIAYLAVAALTIYLIQLIKRPDRRNDHWVQTTDGKYHFIVFTSDGSLYVDGALQRENPMRSVIIRRWQSSEDNKFYARITTGNHEPIWRTTQGYKDRHDRERAIEILTEAGLKTK